MKLSRLFKLAKQAEEIDVCQGTGQDASLGAAIQSCASCVTPQVTDTDGVTAWFVPHQAGQTLTEQPLFFGGGATSLVTEAAHQVAQEDLEDSSKEAAKDNELEESGYELYGDQHKVADKSLIGVTSNNSVTSHVVSPSTGRTVCGRSCKWIIPKQTFATCTRCNGNATQNQRWSSVKEAHDSGDGATIYHCPFCGGGQVVARSDNTTFCDYCQQAFTVQVQPEYPAMPQTIDGQPVDIPGMPGEIGPRPDEIDPAIPQEPSGVSTPDVTPDDPFAKKAPEEKLEGGQEKPKGNQPPWLKNQSSFFYLSDSHLALDKDAYIRHLALKFADDRSGVLEQVKAENRLRVEKEPE